MPSNSITIGNSGANQTWDFSSLQDMEVDIIEVISPVGTPYENIHPDANMCVEIDDELMYLDKSSTGLEMVGYGDIPLNMLMIPLPLVYGLSQQSGPNTVMDSVFSNMFLPDSLAPFISGNFTYNQVDSLKITAVAEDDGEVMGVSHKEYLIEGVQFHPESIMTEFGKKMLENWLMHLKNKK